MSIEIVSYAQEYEVAWDEFCEKSGNATILHTRRFLGYHRDRFVDRSVLIFVSGKLCGVFPAAEIPNNSYVVSSHPGITYGGIVHQGKLRGIQMLSALTEICNHYKGIGYRLLQYKSVPHIYTNLPAQDDLYALFRLGAERVRCDLSSTIDLANREPLSNRRKRGLKKAEKSVSLSNQQDCLPALWKVIEHNLERKHGAKPVHSLEEIIKLSELFPKNIVIRTGEIEGQVEAGVIFFVSQNVWHAQYIAASEIAYAVSALDAVFESAIQEAYRRGVRYFDFGTSNENSGRVLNDGLYRFKSEFGGGGVVHEYYDLMLG